MEHFVLLVVHRSHSLGGTMSKANKDVPELTDQELAFEMIEITCDEMNSLARAFKMISNVCRELNGELPEEDFREETVPAEADLN